MTRGRIHVKQIHKIHHQVWHNSPTHSPKLPSEKWCGWAHEQVPDRTHIHLAKQIWHGKKLLGRVSSCTHTHVEPMCKRSHPKYDTLPSMAQSKSQCIPLMGMGVHSICAHTEGQMHAPRATHRKVHIHWIPQWIQRLEVLYSIHMMHCYIRESQVQWGTIPNENQSKLRNNRKPKCKYRTHWCWTPKKESKPQTTGKETKMRPIQHLKVNPKVNLHHRGGNHHNLTNHRPCWNCIKATYARQVTSEDWWKPWELTYTHIGNKNVANLAHRPHGELRNYTEALEHPDASSWKKAAQEEMTNHLANQTWSLVPIQRIGSVIGSRWGFHLKYNADGSIEQYKARLVAKGYNQWPGFKYLEIFGPNHLHANCQNNPHTSSHRRPTPMVNRYLTHTSKWQNGSRCLYGTTRGFHARKLKWTSLPTGQSFIWSKNKAVGSGTKKCMKF